MQEADLTELSVVMPVWNGTRYLREAIDSILAQTMRNFEFLIIDDGSTDDTVAIIESYQDPRIRLFRQEHEGIVAALNHGVRMARSRWIARMDADDIALPDRFAQQLQALAEHPEAVMCYSDFTFLLANGKTARASYFPASSQILMLQLCWFNPIAHDTVIFRKDAFEQCGGYLPGERHAEDYGLWGRMMRIGRVIGVPRPLLMLRKHEDSISVAAGEIQQGISQHISILHCERFMDLGREDATRASRLLRGETKNGKLLDWLWFLTHGLPRLHIGVMAWIYGLRLALSRMLGRSGA